MSGIIIYEHANFQGKSREFIADIADLKPTEWAHCVSSVKVTNQPWVAYERPNYSGKFLVFEEGEYSCVDGDMNDKITSLKLITENLTNPKITLYENANYQALEFHHCLRWSESFPRKLLAVSSHKVQSGAWLLCENEDGSGLNYVARKDEQLPNYESINFNDKLSFLRPLRAGWR
ncbi:Epidermal differentiation-specific protein [Platysternon megacephalum]|uniref:Epidermal differentiation-specific protein n=1 Tax=Platysternon megacephalum TaxID=55544 RepID=A0A4D9DUK9_9SAUR|nr:Epidermal differentiation-specific protein [Platysternon megacephalum]